MLRLSRSSCIKLRLALDNFSKMRTQLYTPVLIPQRRLKETDSQTLEDKLNQDFRKMKVQVPPIFPMRFLKRIID